MYTLVDRPLAAESYEQLHQEQEEEKHVLLDPPQDLNAPYQFESPATVEGKPRFRINSQFYKSTYLCFVLCLCTYV